MWESLTTTRDEFESPVALLETGRIAILRKLDGAPWASIGRAIQEYAKSPVKVKFQGKEFLLWLGRNKRPERRRRNTMLRHLATLAERNGAKEISICWWRGELRSQGRRLVTLWDSGATEFVTNPFVDATKADAFLEEIQSNFRRERDWQ